MHVPYSGDQIHRPVWYGRLDGTLLAADWTGLSQEVLHVQFGTRFNGMDGRDAAPRNYATYLTYIACVQLG